MPLDAQGLWDREQGAARRRHDRRCWRARSGRSSQIPDRDPARAGHRIPLHGRQSARVGFIASVSQPFCLNCNRIRLTADGKLRYCLFAIDETDVATLLRSGGSDEEIAAAIRENVRAKWIGHEINTRFVPPPRPMYSIGG